MNKLFVIMLAIFFLNGCAQTTSMMGPTYTMVKTGSIIQTGSSVATSYGVKHALGQSPSEYIISLANNDKQKVNKCQNSNSTNLYNIFFDTVDQIDCLRNPFILLK